MTRCDKHNLDIPAGFQCGECVVDSINSLGTVPLSPEQQRIHELTATIERLDTQMLKILAEVTTWRKLADKLLDVPVTVPVVAQDLVNVRDEMRDLLNTTGGR